MSTDLIVSYDGTPNDDDALALARMLARAGASLALAYVRHSREFDPRREELAQHDANAGSSRAPPGSATRNPASRRLQPLDRRGARAARRGEGASVIVFGSDYRTPPGHAEPGTTAQHLLEGGPVAVAVAAAGLRTERRRGDQDDRRRPPTGRRQRAPRTRADALAGEARRDDRRDRGRRRLT